MLGDVTTHELLALKRISFAEHSTARLTFPVSNGAGKQMDGVTLFFMSDSYLGLDQQYFVPVVQNAAKQQSTHNRHAGDKAKVHQQQRGQQALQHKAHAVDQPLERKQNTERHDDGTDAVANGINQISLGDDSQGHTAQDEAGAEAKQQRLNARRRRDG